MPVMQATYLYSNRANTRVCQGLLIPTQAWRRPEINRPNCVSAGLSVPFTRTVCWTAGVDTDRTVLLGGFVPYLQRFATSGRDLK